MSDRGHDKGEDIVVECRNHIVSDGYNFMNQKTGTFCCNAAYQLRSMFPPPKN